VMLEFDGSKAAQSDRIEDSVDYKELTKRIVGEVEQSSFQLIEALANHVLGIVMADERVRRAEVEIDKPGALRFAESVSVSCSAERSR
jgi:D-erythro-7,8-dihydroneopterin triphosphate epimerase